MAGYQRYPHSHQGITHVSVKSRRVIDDSVVPNCHVAGLPSPSGRRVGLLGETIFEEGKSHVTLGFRDANESGDEAWVHEDRLEAGDRVDTHDRVDRIDRRAKWDLDAGGGTGCSLIVAGVDRCERLKINLVWPGKLRVDVVA